MPSYDVDLLVTVRLTVNDTNVIERVLDNHDDEGVPQIEERGGSGWRDTYYDLDDEEAVLGHLATNLGVRERSIANLDGWADLPDEAATAQVLGIRVDHIMDLDVQR